MKIEKTQKEKVRKELVKAYSYFGMDEYDMECEIEEQMDDLDSNYNDVVMINNLEYSGYMLQVASSMGKKTKISLEDNPCTIRNPKILYLFVNNDMVKYVLYEYDLYEDKDGNFIKYKNNTYSFVKLEDISIVGYSLE